MLSGLIVYSDKDKEKNAWFIERCMEKLSEKGVTLKYSDENEVFQALILF